MQMQAPDHHPSLPRSARARSSAAVSLTRLAPHRRLKRLKYSNPRANVHDYLRRAAAIPERCRRCRVAAACPSGDLRRRRNSSFPRFLGPKRVVVGRAADWKPCAESEMGPARHRPPRRIVYYAELPPSWRLPPRAPARTCRPRPRPTAPRHPSATLPNSSSPCRIATVADGSRAIEYRRRSPSARTRSRPVVFAGSGCGFPPRRPPRSRRQPVGPSFATSETGRAGLRRTCSSERPCRDATTTETAGRADELDSSRPAVRIRIVPAPP